MTDKEDEQNKQKKRIDSNMQTRKTEKLLRTMSL